VRALLRLVTVSSIAFPLTASAQTLTPLRGDFSYSDTLTKQQVRNVLRDSVVTWLFADANIRKALGEPGSTAASAGGAAVMWSTYNGNTALTLNVRTQQDTVSTKHGESTLPPGGGSTGLNLIGDWRRSLRGRWGAHVYGSVARLVWQGSVGAGPVEYVNVDVAAFGSQLTLELGSTSVGGGTSITGFVDLGVAVRILFGDVKDSTALRSALLGTGESLFWGPELTGTLQVNHLRVGLSTYFMGRHLHGIVGGVSISAPIIALRSKTKQRGYQRDK